MFTDSELLVLLAVLRTINISVAKISEEQRYGLLSKVEEERALLAKGKRYVDADFKS